MKKIFAIAICSLLASGAFAQNTLKSAPAMPGAPAKAQGAATKQHGAAKMHKSAIAGVIKDLRRDPVPKIQAYIYKNDSIKASGYSNAEGYYETNSVLPGVYSLRLVYPQSGRRITVTGVPVKMLKLTVVNYTGAEPVGDSTIGYNELMPGAVPPKKK